MNELEIKWLMARDAPDVDAILASIANRPVWHDQAACRGMGMDLFFVERGQSAMPTANGRLVRQRCRLRSSICMEPQTTPWGR